MVISNAFDVELIAEIKFTRSNFEKNKLPIFLSLRILIGMEYHFVQSTLNIE